MNCYSYEYQAPQTIIATILRTVGQKSMAHSFKQELAAL